MCLSGARVVGQSLQLRLPFSGFGSRCLHRPRLVNKGAVNTMTNRAVLEGAPLPAHWLVRPKVGGFGYFEARLTTIL